jgi:hypothetical protein
MQQYPSKEANRSSASQQTSHTLWNPMVYYLINNSLPMIKIGYSLCGKSGYMSKCFDKWLAIWIIYMLYEQCQIYIQKQGAILIGNLQKIFRYNLVWNKQDIHGNDTNIMKEHKIMVSLSHVWSPSLWHKLSKITIKPVH